MRRATLVQATRALAGAGCAAAALAACGSTSGKSNNSSASAVPSAARAEAVTLLKVAPSPLSTSAGGGWWSAAPPLTSIKTEELGPISFKSVGQGRLIATARREKIHVIPGVLSDAGSAGVQRAVGPNGVSIPATISVEIGKSGASWQQVGNLNMRARYGTPSETSASVAATRAIKALFSYEGKVSAYDETQAPLYITTSDASGQGYASAPPTIWRFSGQDDDGAGPPAKVVGYSLPSFNQPNTDDDSIGTLLSSGCGDGGLPSTMTAQDVTLTRERSIATVFPTYMFNGSVTVKTGPWTGYVEDFGDYTMSANHCAAVMKVARFQVAVVNTPAHGWLVDYLAIPGLVKADSASDYVGQLYQVCARPGDTADLPTC